MPEEGGSPWQAKNTRWGTPDYNNSFNEHVYSQAEIEDLAEREARSKKLGFSTGLRLFNFNWWRS